MAAEQQPLLDVEPTLGVGELNARVTGALRAAFPAEVWVRGEVHGITSSGPGHLYLTLRDKERGRAPAALSVVLFAKDRRRVERALRDVGFGLAEGIEVRARGRVTYYAPTGRLQLVMSELDPVYTLGRLAADRERVLRALGAEGLLEVNRRHRVPAVPLHVALVASDGSAGCTDFLHQLETSGLGWRVTVVDTRVQGSSADRMVVRALHVAAGRRPDVVCLVRGGGSRTDLAVFDSERIARAAAGLPVPLLTGIGHEVDRSVVDEVAHTAFPTPTACAAALVTRVQAFLARADAAWDGIAAAAPARAGAAEQRVVVAARAVVAATRGAVRVEERSALAATDRLRRAATAAADRSAGRVERAAGRVDEATRFRLAAADQRLLTAGARLRSPALRGRIDEHRRRLDEAARRLGRAAPAALTAAERHADLAAARVAAADPAVALRRGWTITRRPDGGLVRSAADLAPGDELVTDFADGSARSRVLAAPTGPDETPTAAARPPADEERPDA
jgi:exodeoxyribonuclease VII large subunit